MARPRWKQRPGENNPQSHSGECLLLLQAGCTKPALPYACGQTQGDLQGKHCQFGHCSHGRVFKSLDQSVVKITKWPLTTLPLLILLWLFWMQALLELEIKHENWCLEFGVQSFLNCGSPSCRAASNGRLPVPGKDGQPCTIWRQFQDRRPDDGWPFFRRIHLNPLISAFLVD